VNWITANNQCKSLHHDANLVDLNNQSKIEAVIKHFAENPIYQKKIEFHGRLEENSITIKNLKKDKCRLNNKDSLSKLTCPSVVSEGDQIFCINDCERELYYICSYDSTKKSDKDDTFVYSDTLQDYQQDPKMSYVMNSFLAVAYGLDRIHQKVLIKFFTKFKFNQIEFKHLFLTSYVKVKVEFVII
jgi:hypothetical protein